MTSLTSWLLSGFISARRFWFCFYSLIINFHFDVVRQTKLTACQLLIVRWILAYRIVSYRTTVQQRMTIHVTAGMKSAFIRRLCHESEDSAPVCIPAGRHSGSIPGEIVIDAWRLNTSLFAWSIARAAPRPMYTSDACRIYCRVAVMWPG